MLWLLWIVPKHVLQFLRWCNRAVKSNFSVMKIESRCEIHVLPSASCVSVRVAQAELVVIVLVPSMGEKNRTLF